jgi:hypothetical protein
VQIAGPETQLEGSGAGRATEAPQGNGPTEARPAEGGGPPPARPPTHPWSCGRGTPKTTGNLHTTFSAYKLTWFYAPNYLMTRVHNTVETRSAAL